MKKMLFLYAILLSACNGIQVTERLSLIDSLVVKEQYDSACVVLRDLDNTATMTEEEQAHYYLLATQLGYLTNQPLPSDSLLDQAITYYNKVGNNQKLANCYYYKSARSRLQQDYTQAIWYGKKAEHHANKANDDRLQFKIAENLSYLNGLCGNDQLQLLYAKKALTLAQKEKEKNWIIYTYNKISFAFYNLGLNDSALIYIEKSIPYIKYVRDKDKPVYLSNAGLFYKMTNPKKAKEFFCQALTYSENSGTIEHLADIYYAEGNKEEAYRLWKKALSAGGRCDKTNLIHSILSYDLERGRLDEASKYVDRAIAIKDSMLYQLRNDTIKDLQLRFDHEVAMHEADRKLINTQWILIGLVVILGVMAFYIFLRRKKEETLQREHQMQLYAYTTEISQLKANKDKVMAQIQEMKSREEEYGQKITELEEEAKTAELAIKTLNKDIRKLLDDEAPKLKQGRMLYEHIIDGGTAITWSSKEEGLFNNYYAAINYQSYSRLKKVERASKLSAHNLFYLILKEMGKTDEEVRHILGLSAEGLRSLRSRTKPLK